MENTRQLSETLMKVAVEWGGRVVGVLVALFLAWVIGGWLRRVLLRSLDRRGIDATLSRFFANIVRYAVIAGAHRQRHRIARRKPTNGKNNYRDTQQRGYHQK